MKVLGFLSALSLLALASLANAGNVSIEILPPDLAKADVCNRTTPLEEEIDEGGLNTLTAKEKSALLIRDIKNLRKQDPDGAFDYIMRLITLLAETDSEFAGVNEAFERIDLYAMSGREAELEERGLVDGLTLRLDDLTNSQKVQLAHYYLDGTGVNKDHEFGLGLIVLAAYAGNSNALFDLTHLILQGEQPPEWELNLKETATLAYGGMLGKLDSGYCARAERLAREYEDSDILAPNPELAFAWRKHAADFGGRNAAWHVVEHYLNAPAADQDEEALLHYLGIAAGIGDTSGLSLKELQENDLQSAAEVRAFLGYNVPYRQPNERFSAVKYLELENREKTDDGSQISDQLIYLREIAAIPDAPGSIYLRLAKEIATSAGIWGNAGEYQEALENAVVDGEVEAMVMLANYLVSHAPSIENISRAENLLLQAVSLFGHAPAMGALEELYRCRLPNSPMVEEADFWLESYEAADAIAMTIASNDLARLDVGQQPEAYAEVQTYAVRNAASAMANFLQLLQSNPLADDATLRFWAKRVGHNDQSLETYAKHEFALARTASEGQAAVELIRRAYLAIGPAMALDAAVALIDAIARDPEVAQEVSTLLDDSARRGEGASIRLLARLGKNPQAMFEKYEAAIERRGDFLAQTFALEFVDPAKHDEYFRRAQSLMKCTVKDALELAEVAAKIGNADRLQHWMNVSNAVRNHNPLSKLGLSDRQMAIYAEGEAPERVAGSELIDRGTSFAALRNTFWQTYDRNSAAYDPEIAAETLLEIVDHHNPRAAAWAALHYYKSDRDIRQMATELIDINALSEQLAKEGNGEIAHYYAMALRRAARSEDDLAHSTDWLKVSAESGHGPGMLDYGVALGHGIGVGKDIHQAVAWLVRAENLLVPGAGEQIALFSIMDRRN